MSEYYAVVRSTNELAHYGVAGMKWGVRRYQKSDGALTAKGKARVVKAGSYLNPSRKGKDKRHTENRKAVADQYVREWNKKVRPITGEADYGPTKNEKSVWDKHKDSYASATLKDMRLKDTKRARNDIKAILKDVDITYKYYNPDRLSDRKRQKYTDRANKLKHPTREKLKRIAGKASKAISTASGVKHLLA